MGCYDPQQITNLLKLHRTFTRFEAKESTVVVRWGIEKLFWKNLNKPIEQCVHFSIQTRGDLIRSFYSSETNKRPIRTLACIKDFFHHINHWGFFKLALFRVSIDL